MKKTIVFCLIGLALAACGRRSELMTPNEAAGRVAPSGTAMTAETASKPEATLATDTDSVDTSIAESDGTPPDGEPFPAFAGPKKPQAITRPQRSIFLDKLL